MIRDAADGRKRLPGRRQTTETQVVSGVVTARESCRQSAHQGPAVAVMSDIMGSHWRENGTKEEVNFLWVSRDTEV